MATKTPPMTRTEYALFLLTDGNQLDTPDAVFRETGHAESSLANALICSEVKRVGELFLACRGQGRESELAACLSRV